LLLLLLLMWLLWLLQLLLLELWLLLWLLGVVVDVGFYRCPLDFRWLFGRSMLHGPSTGFEWRVNHLVGVLGGSLLLLLLLLLLLRLRCHISLHHFPNSRIFLSRQVCRLLLEFESNWRCYKTRRGCTRGGRVRGGGGAGGAGGGG